MTVMAPNRPYKVQKTPPKFFLIRLLVPLDRRTRRPPGGSFAGSRREISHVASVEPAGDVFLVLHLSSVAFRRS